MSPVHRRRHGGFFLIPAGALIGLGLGIAAGYMWTGFLIGIGAGLVIVTADRPARVTGVDRAQTVSAPGADLVLLIAGVYSMLSGIAMVVVSRSSWPYIAAGFLVLLGIWFIARGFTRGRLIS